MHGSGGCLGCSKDALRLPLRLGDDVCFDGRCIRLAGVVRCPYLLLRLVLRLADEFARLVACRVELSPRFRFGIEDSSEGIQHGYTSVYGMVLQGPCVVWKLFRRRGLQGVSRSGSGGRFPSIAIAFKMFPILGRRNQPSKDGNEVTDGGEVAGGTHHEKRAASDSRAGDA